MSDPDPAPLEPSQQEGTNLEDVFWKHGADLDLSSSLNEAEEDIRCENLADALVQKVTPTAGDLAILDDAIMLYENVLRLRPIGHPRRVEALSSLAGTHVLYCQRQRDALRLQRGISLHQAALALRSVNDSGRIASLEALATALALRYEQEGHGPSLAEALSHIRGALELTPCGHSERPQILSRLAVIHIRFFDHAREDQALVEAASAMREALTLSPPDHPLRDRFLSNMAVITGTLAETHSDLESLTECITTLHEALALQPLGHPRRPLTQGNLSNALRLRFIHHGHKQDLDESIALARVVAEAIPPGHQLYNPFMLAHRLELNFDYGGGPGNLEEAISILRVALETDGLNHFYRNLCTRELGVVLRKSFEQSSDLSRLDDSILWLREALSLCSEDTRHLGVVLLELATSLRLQAHQRQDPSAVAEAIDLLRQSLVEYAQDHTERPLALCESALCLLDSDMPSFDFFAALEYISEAVTDQITPARERLRAGIRSLHAVEAASGVALVDGDLSQAESVLNLYACTMQLLPRVANFGLDHADRLAALAGSEELGRAAASWATLLNRRRQAVELLEEGRGVFWSQALRLRASGLDGITDTDRQALERIFRVLEQGSHDVNRDHSAAQRERGLEKRRALSANADAIISRIRTQPGLQRFLMPPSFLDITRTLADGFVVLLFSSGSRHHALIVSGATKAVQYIALALPEGKLSLPAMKNSIPRDASKEPTDQPDGRGMRLVSTKGRSALVDTLQGLWTCVVKPIVSAMGLKVCFNNTPPSR
jgi:tetratricopeptide (TPR) repeat protein